MQDMQGNLTKLKYYSETASTVFKTFLKIQSNRVSPFYLEEMTTVYAIRNR